MDDLNRYYEILELQPGASEDEIKQAYRQLAKVWHPDRFAHDAAQQQQAEEKIKAINEAYQHLKDRSDTDTEEMVSATDSVTDLTKPVQTVIKTRTSHGEESYNLGVEHVQAGRYKEAIEAFTAAIRINPQYAEAYRYRGFVYSVMGLELSAEADLAKAARLGFREAAGQESGVRSQKPGARSPGDQQVVGSENTASPSGDSPSRPPVSIHPLSLILHPSSEVTALALRPDGKLLVQGGRDRTLQLWNTRTGQALPAITGLTAVVSALAFSPDGQLLVSGGLDGTIGLWYLQSGTSLRNLVGHRQRILSLAVESDRRSLVSVSSDGNLCRWSLDSGQLLQMLTIEMTGMGELSASPGQVTALSPDGKFAAVVDESYGVSLYAVRTGELLRHWSTHRSAALAIAFDSNGQHLAIGSQDGTVQHWSVQGKLNQTWRVQNAVVAIALLNEKTVVSGNAAGLLHQCSVGIDIPIPLAAQHSGGVTELAIAPAMGLLCSSGGDRTIKIWQLG